MGMVRRPLSTARLFIHLLLTVNYEPQRWQGITVWSAGSAWRSLAKLADETGLTVKQVRTALEHLNGRARCDAHGKRRNTACLR